MSESPPGRGGDTTARPPTGRPPRGAPLPTLDLVVVRRSDGPDRATIHPRGLTGIARTETWLSTDCAAVVDLAAWR
ncbi:DUF7511 domain-containing protein [Halobellus salinus]|mgnify:CR=1 FL=1|uniref:DUF7511 domain-containing protein n=1 Tax=Halobellus salinus TaxID=931585 RepID=UPI00166C8944|nr:hypothetical protein [Halobellus salinus]SMP15068.1 hypothetical protein SAMN06265347_10580 [Halobellus salinus]